MSFQSSWLTSFARSLGNYWGNAVSADKSIWTKVKEQFKK
jgi:hypothetical protein